MHTTPQVGARCAMISWLLLSGCAQSGDSDPASAYSQVPSGATAEQPHTMGGPQHSPGSPGEGSTERSGTNEGMGMGAANEPGKGDRGNEPSGGGCDDNEKCSGDEPQDDPAFAGPSKCTSGLTWLFGNQATDLMRPGLACNDCHRRSFQVVYTVAGTLYPTGHEPDDCFGVNGLNSDVKIEVKDAKGKVVVMTPNLTGNFYTLEPLQFPITTRVFSGGKERPMLAQVDQAGGDCNTCHTENGTQSAPGRIASP